MQLRGSMPLSQTLNEFDNTQGKDKPDISTYHTVHAGHDAFVYHKVKLCEEQMLKFRSYLEDKK